jgi:hypothetical protein
VGQVEGGGQIPQQLPALAQRIERAGQDQVLAGAAV